VPERITFVPDVKTRRPLDSRIAEAGLLAGSLVFVSSIVGSGGHNGTLTLAVVCFAVGVPLTAMHLLIRSGPRGFARTASHFLGLLSACVLIVGIGLVLWNYLLLAGIIFFAACIISMTLLFISVFQAFHASALMDATGEQ
jgi:hypothetical protein